MNENYIKISFIWEIELYKQKSTTEILLCSKEYQDIGKHEFSFLFHLQAITWKRFLSIPRQLVQRNQNISSQKAVTRIFHIWTVYKKSVSGLIVAKDSLRHKIIQALSTSTIWDKIFIIYSNKQCHCTESAKWSMLESFDSYAIKLV